MISVEPKLDLAHRVGIGAVNDSAQPEQVYLLCSEGVCMHVQIICSALINLIMRFSPQVEPASRVSQKMRGLP